VLTLPPEVPSSSFVGAGKENLAPYIII